MSTRRRREKFDGAAMIPDDELINLFLAFPTHSLDELSKLTGMPARSLQYRISRPGFAAKLASKRRSSISDAADYGAGGLVECMEVLQEEMRRGDNYSGERIQAAKVFSQITFKATEEAVTRFELLRLRAFIEQKEYERLHSNSIQFEVDDIDGGDCPSDGENRPDAGGSTGGNSHGLTVAARSSTGQGDSTGAADRPADANVGEILVIAEDVVAKFQQIINKNTGKE